MITDLPRLVVQQEPARLVGPAGTAEVLERAVGTAVAQVVATVGQGRLALVQLAELGTADRLEVAMQVRLAGPEQLAQVVATVVAVLLEVGRMRAVQDLR